MKKHTQSDCMTRVGEAFLYTYVGMSGDFSAPLCVTRTQTNSKPHGWCIAKIFPAVTHLRVG